METHRGFFWRSMVKKVASDTVWTPTSYVHMPDAEHTRGFSHLLCHCSDVFRQNLTWVKWVKMSRCNRIWLRKIYSTIQLHRVEEQPCQMTDSQSPVSPAWHPDVALLCLLWYYISRGNSSSFSWTIPRSYCRTFLMTKTIFYNTNDFLNDILSLGLTMWDLKKLISFSLYLLLFFTNMVNNKRVLWNTLMARKRDTHASGSK